VVAADQRLFFFSAPTLDLAFGRCGIFDPLKMLMENQRHRAAMRGITVPGASLMLGYSAFQTVTGCSDII
jgi:hypothetical protein